MVTRQQVSLCVFAFCGAERKDEVRKRKKKSDFTDALAQKKAYENGLILLFFVTKTGSDDRRPELSNGAPSARQHADPVDPGLESALPAPYAAGPCGSTRADSWTAALFLSVEFSVDQNVNTVGGVRARIIKAEPHYLHFLVRSFVAWRKIRDNVLYLLGTRS
ncbi:hypothetical protein EI94DRAFT_1783688 [Lactarius quietus]|nr:hypothetical protein EI94DRAFT_1783688 [Lactarius quietus]